MRARKRNPGQSDWLARIHGDETCRFDAMAASPQRGARASLKRARDLPEPTRLVGKDASQANRRPGFPWIFGPGRNPRRRLHRKLNLFRKSRRGGLSRAAARFRRRPRGSSTLCNRISTRDAFSPFFLHSFPKFLSSLKKEKAPFSKCQHLVLTEQEPRGAHNTF